VVRNAPIVDEERVAPMRGLATRETIRNDLPDVVQMLIRTVPSTPDGASLTEISSAGHSDNLHSIWEVTTQTQASDLSESATDVPGKQIVGTRRIPEQ
jgi:hypothetical protein